MVLPYSLSLASTVSEIATEKRLLTLEHRVESVGATVGEIRDRLGVQDRKQDAILGTLGNLNALIERMNNLDSRLEHEREERVSAVSLLRADFEERKRETEPVVKNGIAYMRMAGLAAVVLTAFGGGFFAWFISEQNAMADSLAAMQKESNERYIHIVEMLNSAKHSAASPHIQGGAQ